MYCVLAEFEGKERATRVRHLRWWSKQFAGLTLAELTADHISKARDVLGTEAFVRGKPRKDRKTGEIVAPREYTRSGSTVNRFIATFSQALSYRLCVVLRERIETCSSRGGVWKVSRLTDRSFDGNRPGLCLLHVGKGCALRHASLRPHLHAITVRGETMRWEPLRDSFATARRAVLNIGHPIHCTERARNLKWRKGTWRRVSPSSCFYLV